MVSVWGGVLVTSGVGCWWWWLGSLPERRGINEGKRCGGDSPLPTCHNIWWDKSPTPTTYDETSHIQQQLTMGQVTKNLWWDKTPTPKKLWWDKSSSDKSGANDSCISFSPLLLHLLGLKSHQENVDANAWHFFPSLYLYRLKAPWRNNFAHKCTKGDFCAFLSPEIFACGA